MKINTIIEIAKTLGMNIDELEVESVRNGRDGYILFDGERTFSIEFVLTETEFMSAMDSPDGVSKLLRAGKIENTYDPKEKYDFLTFVIMNKLI